MYFETRRERLKSAAYQKLKKRKGFKICPERFYEKLTKQVRDTKFRVIFLPNKTRKAHFLQLATNKDTFFGKCSENVT